MREIRMLLHKLLHLPLPLYAGVKMRTDCEFYTYTHTYVSIMFKYASVKMFVTLYCGLFIDLYIILLDKQSVRKMEKSHSTT